MVFGKDHFPKTSNNFTYLTLCYLSVSKNRVYFFYKIKSFIKYSREIKNKYGYVRVSSKTQESNSSIESQKQQLIQIEEQLAKGNDNPGIGRKPICNGVIEHRGKNGGRLYVREADGVIEILAKSGKKKSNQQFVINRLKEIYG